MSISSVALGRMGICNLGPRLSRIGVYSTWMVILIELMYLSSWSFSIFWIRAMTRSRAA